MFGKLSRKLWRLCSRIRCLLWRQARPKVIIRRFRRLSRRGHRHKGKPCTKCSSSDLSGKMGGTLLLPPPIRIATFNAALFSLAPAVPLPDTSFVFDHGEGDQTTPVSNSPKSILKQSPLHPTVDGSKQFPMHNKIINSKPTVSMNLPGNNEILFSHDNLLGILEDSSSKINSSNNRSLAPVRSPLCFPFGMPDWMNGGSLGGGRTILNVLREVDADVLALQDVKAEEEKNMKPLSDLASALGMNFVFAESWAPEYGNAILSKWPIKRWKIQKVFDEKDFRNVLKTTIDVPWAGDLNFYCTQLDHLDENWRMKQVDAIIQSNDHPYILAGGLNSLDGSDYSQQRWTEIARYFGGIGKPAPKIEVMNFLRGKQYIDAKDFAGEHQPVVTMAAGQNTQGTCKHGTRVDYILASPELSYEFIPGSYSVISSKGTSDHHIVKVDIVKACSNSCETSIGRLKRLRKKVTKITKSCLEEYGR